MRSLSAIHTLLHQSIDYAGLFPPAGLGMAAAVDNYRRYQAGPDAWALGRFILPASRLAEFEEAAHHISPGGVPRRQWRLSALVGPDFIHDLDQIAAFNRSQVATATGMLVDTIEAKADRANVVQEAMGKVPEKLDVYFELPIDRDPTDLLSALARAGARAKVRTGGVTPEAFPSTSNLVRFIYTALRHKVPFKATAGLHHALRAEYKLTYEPDSGKGMMFGFVNLFLATALVRDGMDERDTGAILEEASATAIRVDDGAIGWRDRRLDREALSHSRESLISYGSCSFTEPIAELQALGWLQPEVHQA